MPKINRSPSIAEARAYFEKKKAKVKKTFADLEGQTRIRTALAEATNVAHRLKRYSTWSKQFDTVADAADVPTSRVDASPHIRLLKYLEITDKPTSLNRYSEAIEACLRVHSSREDRREAMIEEGPMTLSAQGAHAKRRLRTRLNTKKRFVIRKK